MEQINSNEILDLRGVACPHNTARVLLKLATMAPGAILEITIDNGDPIKNVPPVIEEEGHAIIETHRAGHKWILLVRKT